MAEKQKKDNIFKRIASYFKALKSEVKKVTWPSKKQVVNNTGIVIVCLLIVGVIIFLLNTIFGGAFGFFTTVGTEDATDTVIEYQDATGALVEETSTEGAE